MTMLCPKCNKPMKLVKEKGQRFWRCSDWSSIGSHCPALLPYDGEEPIPIKIVAEDMARESFATSADKGKDQANYRRVAGGIKNLSTSKYLSVDESDTLLAAAEIIERLATAAELAKKDKKRLEREEQERQKNRGVEAWPLLEQAFGQESDLKDMITTALVLCRLNHNDYYFKPGYAAHIQNVAQARNVSFLMALQGDVMLRIKGEIHDIKQNIAYQYRPVVDLVSEIIEKYHEEQENVLLNNATVLDEVLHAITIHSTENIVVLKKQ